MSRSAAATASAASGSIGVVAAWSRYAIAGQPTAVAGPAPRPARVPPPTGPPPANPAGAAAVTQTARACQRQAARRRGRAARRAPGRRARPARAAPVSATAMPASAPQPADRRVRAATSARPSPMHSALAAESDSCRAEESTPRSAGGLNEQQQHGRRWTSPAPCHSRRRPRPGRSARPATTAGRPAPSRPRPPDSTKPTRTSRCRGASGAPALPERRRGPARARRRSAGRRPRSASSRARA